MTTKNDEAGGLLRRAEINPETGKVEKPPFTMVQNNLFDRTAHLSANEFRLLMQIARQTVGWKNRDKAKMSFARMAKKCNMSKTTVIKAAITLMGTYRHITVTVNGRTTYWQLNYAGEEPQDLHAHWPAAFDENGEEKRDYVPETGTSDDENTLNYVPATGTSEEDYVPATGTSHARLKKEKKERKSDMEFPYGNPSQCAGATAPPPAQPIPSEKKSPKRKKVSSEEESDVQRLMELFSELTGLRLPENPRSQRNKRYWYDPVLEIYRQASSRKTTAFAAMDDAINTLHNRGYTVATPNSILKTALGWLQRYHRPEKGLTVDDNGRRIIEVNGKYDPATGGFDVVVEEPWRGLLAPDALCLTGAYNFPGHG